MKLKKVQYNVKLYYWFWLSSWRQFATQHFVININVLFLNLSVGILLVSKLNKQMTASLHKHQLHYIETFLVYFFICFNNRFFFVLCRKPKISQINKSWFLVSKQSSERLMHCHFNFVALLLKNNIICFQRDPFYKK